MKSEPRTCRAAALGILLSVVVVLGAHSQCDDSILWDQFTTWAKSDAEGTTFAAAVSLFDFGPPNILLIDRPTGTQHQITIDQEAYDDRPDASRDFQWISFVSDGDYAGTNSDGSNEAFLYSVASGVISQMTDNVEGLGVRWPDLTDDGSVLYYWTQVSGGTRLHRLTLATGQDDPLRLFTGIFGFREVDSSGTQFVVWSEEDWTGENADGSVEIFLYDALGDSFEQLTDSPITNETSWAASADETFEKVAFITEAESIVGPNPSGINLPVVLDRLTGVFTVLDEISTMDALITRDGSAVILRRSGGSIWRHDLRDHSMVQVTAEDPFTVLYTSDDDGGWIPFGATGTAGRQLRVGHCLLSVFEDGFESGDTEAWSTTVP